MRQGALIAGISLLSVVALAGWMRTPGAPGAQAAAYVPSYTPAPALNQYGMAAAPRATAAVYERPVARPRIAPRTDYAPQYRDHVVARKPSRPFSHSAAIVGGSAGAGAAIGALAGGGKGAGIGALAGGAAGLIYDRLTHNR